MTTRTIQLPAYSIQAASPSQQYGQPSVLPISNAAAIILLRAALAGIPAAASVTSAVVNGTTAAASSGSSTVSVQPATSGWTSGVTWATKPTTTTALDSATRANPTPGTAWSWDVTAWAQGVVAGTIVNNGLQVYTTGANPASFTGSHADSGAFTLTITYALLPDAPTNLHPASGVVSTSTPTFSFDGDDDMVSLQLQIDVPPGGSGGAYDTGEVPATAGLFSLVGTGHGLSPGDVRVWRARQKNASGWSPWCSWTPLTYTAKSSLAIISPGAGTITDGTPLVQWTFGGTQVAWQVRITDATTGKVLADSKKRIGTATSWTPTKGLTKDGQSAIISVWIWDDVDRAATSGDPVQTVATVTVTLDLDDGVGPMDTVDVIQAPPNPAIRIQGTRAEGVPDQVALFRDGVQINRWAGSAVFTGSHFAVYDHTAPMRVPVTYRVAPITVTGGVAHIAKGGTARTYVPDCAGIWLVDESDPATAVAVWQDDGQDDGQDQTTPETAVVHTPITSDGSIEVVRRRLVTLPPQGSVIGTLTDAVETFAATSEAALRKFKTYDAGHLYRLILGRQNLRVIVGDIDFKETAADTVGNRVLEVSFNWWARADQT